MFNQAILANIGKHIHLNDRQSTLILDTLAERAYLPGEYLLQAGEVSTNANYILFGRMSVNAMNQHGQQYELYQSIADSWVNDYYSFFTTAPANHTIIAIEPTTVLQLTKAQIQHLFAHIPGMDRFFHLCLLDSIIASVKYTSPKQLAEEYDEVD